MMKALIPVVMILLNWTLDTNDKAVQQNIMYVFTAVHVGVFAVVAYLYFRVFTSSVEGTVVVPLDPYAIDSKAAKTESITFREYDQRKMRELIMSKMLMPIGIMMFIYSRWGVILPLMFQCFNNPNQLYQSPLFQIHVLGKAPRMELARPWEEPSPVPSWLKDWMTPADDKAGKKNKKK